jgi:hypothetical protein
MLKAHCVWSLWVERNTCLRDRTEAVNVPQRPTAGSAQQDSRGVDPEMYLRDVLSRIAITRPEELAIFKPIATVCIRSRHPRRSCREFSMMPCRR